MQTGVVTVASSYLKIPLWVLGEAWKQKDQVDGFKWRGGEHLQCLDEVVVVELIEVGGFDRAE